MKKICFGCREEFICYGTDDCWCHNVQLSKNTLKTLKSVSSNCFCQKCLLIKNAELDNLKK